MITVQNPIIIDQFYCPQGNSPLKDGGVAIRDARFIKIHGTSSEQQAIKILSSQSVRCRDICLKNVNLSWGNHTAPANAYILNAYGTTAGMVVPKVQFHTLDTECYPLFTHIYRHASIVIVYRHAVKEQYNARLDECLAKK